MAETVLPESTPKVLTATGNELLVVLLLPNWPKWFHPQLANVPSEQSARLCWAPAPNAITVLPESAPTLLTATGINRFVVLPSPNSPSAL